MKKLILTIILVDIIILPQKRSYLIPTDSDGSLIVSEEENEFYPKSCKITIDETGGYEFAFLVCLSFKLYIKDINEPEQLSLKLNSIFLAGAFKDSEYTKILDRTNLPEDKFFNSLEELEKEGFRFLIYDVGDDNKPLSKEYEIDFTKNYESNITEGKNIYLRHETIRLKFLFLEFKFTIYNRFSFHDDFPYLTASENRVKISIQEKQVFLDFEIKSYSPETIYGDSYFDIFFFKGFSKDLTNKIFENFENNLEIDNKENKQTIKNVLFRYPTKKEKEDFVKSTETLMVRDLSNKRDLLDKIKTIEFEEKREEKEEKKDYGGSNKKDKKEDHNKGDNENKPKENSNWGLRITIIISVIVLILIVFVGFVYHSKKKSYKL